MSKQKSYWTNRRHLRNNVERHIAEIHAQINFNDTTTSSADESHATEDWENACNSYTQAVSGSGEASAASPDVVCIDDNSDTSISQSDDIFDEHNILNCGSDSNSDSEEREFSTEDFVDELREWALKFQIPLISLGELLKTLRKTNPSLPKDPRTLLKTQKYYTLNDISGGQYYHFGIQKCIEDYLSNTVETSNDTVLRLQVNVDGLPLFKSTNDQFWPILGRIENFGDRRPFVIGLFYGMRKPVDASSYLDPFKEEFNALRIAGIHHEGNHFTLSLSSIICDAPARAFLKNTKQYSGYHGCDKCTQTGEWQGRMTFPETDAPLRTDESFNEMRDEDHHKGPPALEGTGIGMISQLPFDYMHLVCLGVMKRLLLMWIKGPLKSRVSARTVAQISSSLLSLRDYIPSEFSRRPRSLSEIDRWKATEFRQFLLYTGPVVLKHNLNQTFYDNFLTLCIGMHILLNSSLCQNYNDYAKQLMVAFVRHFGELYGRDMLVYSVHGLVHLASDAVSYGSLDNISAFPFENFLQTLKRMVRKPKFPLQQVIRRLSESRATKSVQSKFPSLKFEHNNGPVPESLRGSKQYSTVQTETFCLKTSTRDSCVRVRGQIGQIRNILKTGTEISIVYCRGLSMEDFFTTPLQSSLLGIHKLSGFGDNLHVASLREVQAKCVLLPARDKLIAIPFTDSIW